MANQLNSYGVKIEAQTTADISSNLSGSADTVLLYASGSGLGSRLYVKDGSNTQRQLGIDIDSLDALGGAGLHQTDDHFMFSDDGTEKKITFSNLQDAVFADVSGDATIAAGGTLTIAADSVENSMLANITRGSVKVGGASDAPTDLDAKTSGQILVGDGTDIASVAVSGDATLAANGAVTLAAAQTNVTSLLATDIKIGEDDETKIDFETADEIHFYANNVEQVYLADNIFGPQSDSDVDLGTTGVRWKDAYVDSVTVTDNVTIGGDLTVNGTTTTVNSTAVEIGDRIIELNTAGAAGDSGLYVQDVNSTNTGSLLWDTSNNRWYGGVKGAEVNLVTISSTDTLTNKTLTSPDINGGTVDGATIGATSQSSVKATSISGSATLHVVGASTFGAANYASIGATGAISGSGACTVLNITTDKVTAADCDINGGAIDGTIIGAASKAALAATTGSLDMIQVSMGYGNNGISLDQGTINMDGSLKVGNADVASDLFVYAVSDSDGTAGGYGGFMMGWDGDATNHLSSSALGQAKGTLQVSGTLLMGKSSASSGYALDIATGFGNVRADAFVTYSDRELKKDITPIDDSLDKVMKLEAVSYNMKHNNRHEIGFVAQDVAKVVPEIVAMDNKGIGRGIDYGRLTSLLAGAVQAQQSQIAELRAKIEKLQE